MFVVLSADFLSLQFIEGRKRHTEKIISYSSRKICSFPGKGLPVLQPKHL